MLDRMGALLRSRAHSLVARAPMKRLEIDEGPPTSSLVRHVPILAMANSLVVILLGGLSMAPRPSDRILYVAFSPFDGRDHEERIVAAGGRAIEGTTWPFVYRVTFDRDDGLARLEAGGVVLVLAAVRLPICSASRGRA